VQTLALAPAVGRIGFRAGLIAFSATVAFDIVQLLQIVGVLHFPLDEILIFGASLCIVVPFVLEMLAFHHSSAIAKRIWTHAVLIFTTMYAVFATTNYVVQLATVIPAKMRGTEETVRLLEQTPHSLLWDVDAMAYIMMGIATLVSIPALDDTAADRRVRIACIANVAATMLSCVVYFHPAYSNTVLLLGIPWAVTAPAFMLLLAIALRTREARPAA
jgi:hypothetical protein